MTNDTGDKRVIGRPFQPGQSGNPNGRPKSKPFKESLRRLVDAAENDTEKLDLIAKALYGKALEGDVSAIREIADRLDGKVATPIENGDDAFQVIHRIERVIVDPKHRDS